MRCVAKNLAVLAGISLAASCVLVRPGGPEDREERIRFHDWWNFYERGAKRMLRQDYDRALEDMETCLGIRRGARFGYPKDSRFERTYGLHIIEDYFPHRELAVCCYHLGDLQRAVALLEKSLSQEPSARARYYLNRTRARLIAGQKPAAPRVDLAPLPAGNWTRERRVTVSGTARAEGYVASLRVGGSEVAVELAEHELPFLRDVALRPGTNRIVVVARDLLGAEGGREVECIADWQPPGMAVNRTGREGDGWQIEAACYDDYGVAAVSVNGREVFRVARGEHLLRTPISFGLPASGRGIVEIADIAGNRARFALSAEDLLARRHLEGAVRLCAVGSAGAVAALAQAAPPSSDTLAPTVRLANPSTTITCFEDEFYLEGHVEEWSGLRSVAINGEDLLKTVEKKPVGHYYFARCLTLESSTNRFEVVATDMAGNAATKAFRVIRQDPEYLDEVFRLRVAVLPPRGEGTLGPLARHKMKKVLNEGLRRFHVEERDDDRWERIFGEFDLSRTPLVNRKAFVRLGRALPVEFFLAGTLVRYADGLAVLVDVVDAATGSIVFSSDVFVPGLQLRPSGDIDFATATMLEERMRGLVARIKHRFPLLQAEVESVSRKNWAQILVSGNGARVTIDAGTASGVNDWTRFVVVKPAKRGGSAPAGRVLHVGEEYVQLRVTRISENGTVGTVIPRAAGRHIEPGDFVCTR
jgi:hypothetical protein